MSTTLSNRAAPFAAAVALLIVMAGAQPVRALGPTALLFYGGALNKPVIVTGTDVDVFGDLLRRSTIAAADLAGRPFVNVALFWGSPRDPAQNGTPVADLKPEMAWQHGRFYAPSGSQPAVLLATQLRKSTQPVPLPTNEAAFVTGGALADSALPVLQRLGLAGAPGRSRGR